MKKWILPVLLVSLGCSTKAYNPYRAYLLTKQRTLTGAPTVKQYKVPVCMVPRYEIPKGSVFCRMEDKLTRLTGVWIKIGVK